MASLIPWGGSRRAFDPSSWDIWDPFDVSVGGGFPLWDTSRRPRVGRDETTAIAHTHVDWRETPDAHIFRADIPGVKREEVKVNVEDGNVLEISGERTKEEEEGKDTWHRMERRRGSFLRRFRLPDNADMDAVSCSLDHGVLTVTVPKKEAFVGGERNIRAINIS